MTPAERGAALAAEAPPLTDEQVADAARIYAAELMPPKTAA